MADTGKEKGTQKDSEQSAANPFKLPSFDFDELLKRFQLPGVDLGGLIESERKNIDALREANQALLEGWQELASQQRSILEATMQQWQKAMSGGLPGSAGAIQEAMGEQAQLTREAFEQALENMRSLAEISARSQNKAFEVIRRRIEQRIEEFTGQKNSD